MFKPNAVNIAHDKGSAMSFFIFIYFHYYNISETVSSLFLISGCEYLYLHILYGLRLGVITSVAKHRAWVNVEVEIKRKTSCLE